MLRDDINNALKVALKAGDKRGVSTLRLVNSALKNADIEARGARREPLSNDEIIGLLQKMIKQRQESAELYQKGGRGELAQQEREEIEIIAAYLPRQMADEEAKIAAAAVINEIGAQGMRDMGKVMAALRARHAGRMDFSKASAIVKGLLAG